MEEIHHQVIHRCKDEDGVIEVIDDALTRNLYFGSRAKQSSMLLCNHQILVLNYTQAMTAALLFHPKPRNILLIGLGGGSLARFFHHHYPLCQITAVENRAAVIEVAQRFFFLPDDRMQLHAQCARSYLAQEPDEKFDLIFLDIFTATGMDSDLDEPSFFQRCRERLTTQGILSANLWATRPSLCKQYLKTLKRSFESQTLELPAPNCGNLIAFAFNQASKSSPLKDLNFQAELLQQQTGIDYPDFVRRMGQRNRFSLRRLFG